MPLSDADITARLGMLPGWVGDARAIRKEYRLGSFRAAITFLVRLAFEAEQRDHHPEIFNVYDRVTITLTTHDAGGVTEKDFDLATAIDAVA